jgi:hypothetical protein
MIHFSTDFVWRLCWTLIHSCWQILIIACIVGIALSLIPRKSARARYGIACLGLFALYVIAFATFANVSPQKDLPIAMTATVDGPSVNANPLTTQDPNLAIIEPDTTELATGPSAAIDDSLTATPTIQSSLDVNTNGQLNNNQQSVKLGGGTVWSIQCRRMARSPTIEAPWDVACFANNKGAIEIIVAADGNPAVDTDCSIDARRSSGSNRFSSPYHFATSQHNRWNSGDAARRYFGARVSAHSQERLSSQRVTNADRIAILFPPSGLDAIASNTHRARVLLR